MLTFVTFQIVFVNKRFWTSPARKRLFIVMTLWMRNQSVFMGKGFRALSTMKHFYINMWPFVHFKSIFSPKCLTTNITDKFSFTCMFHVMPLECKHIKVGQRTLIAHELWAFSFVGFDVALICLLLHKRLSTFITPTKNNQLLCILILYSLL